MRNETNAEPNATDMPDTPPIESDVNPAVTAAQRKAETRDLRRWWIKLILQPALGVALLAALIVTLGIAQRLGWISGGNAGGAQASTSDQSTRFICPMMCTPPQAEPGRCPVCAMELVPATSNGGNTDGRSIQVDSAARRVAKIQTATVQSVSLTRTIRAIGEISYDEGTLKTISAYVDGRLDRLYADYTGVVVNEGDHLALVYSPRLYSGQVELLLAKKAKQQSRTATLQRVIQSNAEIYESAKQRLIELGMTEPQIDQLEQAGEATSRLHLCAPISGTVIEKFAVEGQYVKEGQPIYKVADLSTVWLMLQLFPDDAELISYGQKVVTEIQSLPGRSFAGRVAFVDPNVDPTTRTVGVRVVIPNSDGRIRVGDYARSTIQVQLAGLSSSDRTICDPELADKWISPRHPHVVETGPGKCRVCGVELVPAAQMGFVAERDEKQNVLVVPRNSVLMAGESSVVYVETKPGRFEFRQVVLGPTVGDQIVIVSGVREGEQVATRGNFLIDSQMQLAGNASLIDPTKAQPILDEAQSPELIAALAKLPPPDQALAKQQQICPVADTLLGSMGTPIKVDVQGTPVFICCEGCRSGLLEEPKKYFDKLAARPAGSQPADSFEMDLPPIETPQLLQPIPVEDAQLDASKQAKIMAAIAQLPASDQPLAQTQQSCPVADTPLGSMGTPIKVDVNGRPVFICCEGCRKRLLAEPRKYLAKLPKETVR